MYPHCTHCVTTFIGSGLLYLLIIPSSSGIAYYVLVFQITQMFSIHIHNYTNEDMLYDTCTLMECIVYHSSGFTE